MEIKGPAGYSTPKLLATTAAVAKKAAQPVPSALAQEGGSRRLSRKAKAGPNARMPAEALYDRINDSEAQFSGCSSRLAKKAKPRLAAAGCGRSSKRPRLAYQNMSAARSTDGSAPVMAMYTPISRQLTRRAVRFAGSQPSSKPSMPVSMDRCCPDRARIWAQPACRKLAASSEFSWSRTPSKSASISGAASAPAACRIAASRAWRALKRSCCQGGAACFSRRSAFSANQSSAGPFCAGTGFACTVIREPGGKASPPRT